MRYTTDPVLPNRNSAPAILTFVSESLEMMSLAGWCYRTEFALLWSILFHIVYPKSFLNHSAYKTKLGYLNKTCLFQRSDRSLLLFQITFQTVQYPAATIYSRCFKMKTFISCCINCESQIIQKQQFIMSRVFKKLFILPI